MGQLEAADRCERHLRSARRRVGKWLLHAALAVGALGPAAAAGLSDRFIDPEDGKVDLSEHLLEHRGALPVPIIITEPAVGTGGGAALLYFRESIGGAIEKSKARGERLVVPDIGGLAAFKTSNGSQGAATGYYGTLSGDRFRYLGAIAKAELNLDFYGLGSVPRRFSIDAPVLVAQGLARIGESDWLAGARYLRFDGLVRFELDTPAEIPTPQLDTGIGRLSLLIDYDSRDNMFTPSRGTYVEVDIGAARPGLGGTSNFDSVFARGMTYLPLGRADVLGLRADGKFTRGDVPFYARPFVMLRGVPAMRYQGRNSLVFEGEVRHAVDARWGVVAFAGAGKAYGDAVPFGDAKTIGAGGAGFRYLIARKLGLYAGLDVARGPEETVVYVQVGSAWY